MTTDAARAQRTAWWLFAPPALLAALRWWLQWQAERHPGPPAWRLSPLPPPQATALDLLLPGLAVLAAVFVAAALLVLLARRRGGAAVRRVLLGAWVLACLAGGAALGLHAANLQGLQAQPPAQAQVLGSRARVPHLHSTGGTELELRIEGVPAAQQVLIDAPEAATWASGQRLELQRAQGRWYGHYATGWRLIMAP